MSFTYEDVLNLALPANGDESHGAEMRQNLTALAMAHSPKDSYFVSPDFTTANLFNGSAADRRHFPTVQEAITAATYSGSSYAVKATVFIWPGLYPENLVLPSNITLAAMIPPMHEGLGGGIGVRISGTTTFAGPTVQMVPDGVGLSSFNLININLSNSYNQNNAVVIDEAQLLEIVQPASYDNSAYIGLKGCNLRAQTSGRHNIWSYGIRAEGYARLVMEDCNMKAWGDAGGDRDGGIKKLVSLRGDSTNTPSRGFTFYSKRSEFYNQYLGGPVHLPCIFDIDNGVTGTVARSGWKMEGSESLLLAGATGTNVITGLSGSTIEQYGNTDGICLSWL